MREALEDHLVDGEAVEVPELINLKDRHVVGSAIHGDATVIVTHDRRLRSEIDVATPDLQAVDVDEFSMQLWASSPAGVSAVVDAMVHKRQRPPVRRSEVTDALRMRMPRLVGELLAR